MTKKIRRIPPFSQNHALKIFLICFVFFYVYVFYLSHLNFVVEPKLRVADSLYQKRYEWFQKHHADKNLPLAVISIDDASLRVLKQRWPWRRHVFAQLVDILKEANPRVIAFDLSFSVPSESAQDDDLFEEAIKQNGNVVLGAYLNSDQELIEPISKLKRSAAQVGFLDVPRDRDNTNRRHWVSRMTKNNQLNESFSFKIASHFLKRTPLSSLGQESYWTVYDYAEQDIEVISFWKIIQNEYALKRLQDKILIVGATGEIFHDVYNTPLGVFPGVIIHANQVIAYLDGKTIREVSSGIFYTFLLIYLFVLAYVFYRCRMVMGVAVMAAIILGSYQVCVFLMYVGVLVDMFSVMGMVITAFLIASVYRSLKLFVENRRLLVETGKDGLTGLYTYRYLEQRLKTEYDKTRKHTDAVLSFLIFDLDHFKRLNDTFGHEKGNDVLIAFSDILTSYSREEDLVARYGGEEFCVLLPRRKKDEAFLIAERIRQTLENKVFEFVPKGASRPDRVKVTVSVGICSTEFKEAFNGKELLRLSDSALLTAKDQGRNQVCIYTPN